MQNERGGYFCKLFVSLFRFFFNFESFDMLIFQILSHLFGFIETNVDIISIIPPFTKIIFKRDEIILIIPTSSKVNIFCLF